MGAIRTFLKRVSGRSRSAFATQMVKMRRGLPHRTRTDVIDYQRWAQSWVYVCMERNSTACGQIPIRLFRRDGSTERRTKALTRKQLAFLKAVLPTRTTEDAVEVEDHPVLEALKQPNPVLDQTGLVWLTAAHLQLGGQAYWHVPKSVRGVEQIWPLPAQWVDPIIGGDKLYEKYRLRVHGTMIEFPADEIVHFRKPSVLDTLGGMGPLRGIIEAAESNMKMLEYERALFENYAVPDMLITAKGETSPDQLNDIMASWEAQYGGWRNTGRVASSPVELNVEKLGFNLRELQFKDERATVRDEILAGFGVPLPVVKADGTPFNNMSHGISLWKRNTVQPLMKTITETVNCQLMPRFSPREADGAQPGAPNPWFLGFDDPAPEDVDAKVVRLTQLVQTGVLTINQALAQLDEEDVEWGEQPWISMGLRQPDQISASIEAEGAALEAAAAVPTEGTIAEAPPPTFGELSALFAQLATLGDVDGANLARQRMAEMMGGGLTPLDEIRAAPSAATVNPDDQPEPEEPPPGPGNPPGAPRNDDSDDDKDKPPPKEWTEAEHTKRWTDAYWTKDNLQAMQPTSHRQQFKTAVETFLEKLNSRILVGVAGVQELVDAETGGLPGKSAIVQLLMGRKEMIESFVTNTRGILIPMIELGTQLGVKELAAFNIEVGFVTPMQIQTATRIFAAKTGASIVDTVTDRAADLVLERLKTGTTTADITRELSDKFATQSRSHATAIARTEVNNALNAGATLTYIESDVTKHKWLASSQPCEFCEAMDGKEVEIGEPFANVGDTIVGVKGGRRTLKYREILHPTLHPNCVCTTIPLID